VANITKPGAPDRDSFRVQAPKDHTSPQDFARFVNDLNKQMNRIAEKFHTAIPDVSNFITPTDLPGLLDAITTSQLDLQTQAGQDSGPGTTSGSVDDAGGAGGGGGGDEGAAAVEEIHPVTLLVQSSVRPLASAWSTLIRPVAGSYGSATMTPVITVDPNGRIQSITSVATSPTTSSDQFTNAVLAAARGWQTTIRPVAGSYGSSTQTPVIVVDANGRVQSISNVTTAPTSSSETFTNPILAAARGWQTTVRPAAGTYGSSSLIPVVTVDANGRVTSITTVSAAAVASTFVNPTIAAARGWQTSLRPVAGTYGSGSLVPVVTVDQNGRVQAITTTAVTTTSTDLAWRRHFLPIGSP
jgi:hypothetical protein